MSLDQNAPSAAASSSLGSDARDALGPNSIQAGQATHGTPPRPMAIDMRADHWIANEAEFNKAQRRGAGGVAHQKLAWVFVGGGGLCAFMTPQAPTLLASLASTPGAMAMALAVCAAGAGYWGRRAKEQSMGAMVHAVVDSAVRVQHEARKAEATPVELSNLSKNAIALASDTRASAFGRLVGSLDDYWWCAKCNSVPYS